MVIGIEGGGHHYPHVGMVDRNGDELHDGDTVTWSGVVRMGRFGAAWVDQMYALPEDYLIVKRKDEHGQRAS